MKSQHKSGSQNMAQFGPHLIMLNSEAEENPNMIWMMFLVTNQLTIFV